MKFTLSYFSLTPFGYANFFPLLTGLISVFITLLSLLALFEKTNRPWFEKAVLIGATLGFIFSILPSLVFDSEYTTPVGLAVRGLFLLLLALQIFVNKKEKV